MLIVWFVSTQCSEDIYLPGLLLGNFNCRLFLYLFVYAKRILSYWCRNPPFHCSTPERCFRTEGLLSVSALRTNRLIMIALFETFGIPTSHRMCTPQYRYVWEEMNVNMRNGLWGGLWNTLRFRMLNFAVLHWSLRIFINFHKPP